MVKCKDNSYYVGVTNNVGKRIWEHNNSTISGYTQKRRPVTLVYFQEFKDINDAIAFEKQLKGWRRLKKDALVKRDITTLKNLSKSYGGRAQDDYPHGSSGSP
ncbi:MAG: GIY-YIG nuclease family protein [bacterium]